MRGGRSGMDGWAKARLTAAAVAAVAVVVPTVDGGDALSDPNGGQYAVW